jgi:membrane protease YdiL (CAAX protease family)
MLWTLPFLIVVGLVAPILAIASLRAAARTGSDPAQLPSSRAMAMQTLVAQGVILALAWLALRAPGILVAWRSRIDASTAGAAIAVVAASLLVASLEARRPLGPSDGLRKHLRSIRATDPWWLSVVVVASIGEEFAYRGVLTGILAVWIGVWPAALASAAIFGIAHATQGRKGFAMSAAFGLAMQGIVALSGGLALAVLAHLVYDLGATELGRRTARSESENEPAENR